MKRIWFLILLPLLLVSACGQGSRSEELAKTNVDESYEAPPPPGEPSATEAEGGRLYLSADAAKPEPSQAYRQASQTEATPAERQRMVIHTGQLTLQTTELDSAVAQAKRLADSAGGYVGSENLNNTGYDRQTHQLVLRIPRDQFHEVVAAMEKLATYVADKQLQAQDVTEEFVDNESRLKSLRATEQQYLEVLRQARNVEEILQVRDYLGRVRTEIELYEGRQRYLSNQVSLSTLTVTFYKLRDLPTAPGESFWYKMGRAFENGWEGILGFLVGFFTLWPLWIAVGVVVVLIRRWRRRRKQRHDTTA